jgi:hypothetical protein
MACDLSIMPALILVTQGSLYTNLFPDPDGGTNAMSHVVEIATRVHDPAAVAAACRRLGLPEPFEGTARLYSGEASGLIVQLPGWRYPAVIDTASGTMSYDVFEGRWKA